MRIAVIADEKELDALDDQFGVHVVLAIKRIERHGASSLYIVDDKRNHYIYKEK